MTKSEVGGRGLSTAARGSVPLSGAMQLDQETGACYFQHYQIVAAAQHCSTVPVPESLAWYQCGRFQCRPNDFEDVP